MTGSVCFADPRRPGIRIVLCVTVARGTAAPLGSVTSPEMAPLVPLCATIKHGLTTVNIQKKRKLYLHARIARTSTSDWFLVLGLREGFAKIPSEGYLGIPKLIRYT